jgi:hypothetical protein
MIEEKTDSKMYVELELFQQSSHYHQLDDYRQWFGCEFQVEP